MIGLTNAIEDLNSNYEQLINYSMLYDSGDECEEVTGGWEVYAASSAYLAKMSIAKNTDNIKATSTGSTGSVNYNGGARTVNAIDLSAYSYMLYDCLPQEDYTYYGFRYDTIPPEASRSGWEDQYIGALKSNTTTAWSCKYNGTNSVSYGFRQLRGNSLDTSYLDSTTRPCFHVFDGSNIMYNCALFKADDWETLASLARITASSIDDVLTKSIALLNNEEAVEFMIKRCTGDFMAKAIQSETFLIALNNSTYKTKIYANEHWIKFLTMVV